MFKKFWKRIQIGRTVNALNRLDDATLRDIGISRSEIIGRAIELNK